MMEFINFARSLGVEIDPSRLESSNKIKRCGTSDKPRSTNGAYFWDGRRGWVFNWADDATVHWFDDPNATPWTDEEKAEWRARKKRQRDNQEQGYQRAARGAAEALRTAVPGPHDYLIRKGLRDAQGLVLPDGDLIVPMRSLFTNEVQGAQRIHWNAEALKWEKKMWPAMRAKGAVYRFGPRSVSETIFCEGYATGLSIECATRQMRLSAAVVVCFSDHNMVHVAERITSGRRYVFADNDRSGAGERAARATGLSYCMSPLLGEDANDLHVRAGVVAVGQLLMRARQGVAVT